jgi:16S rRNA (adenine(1408)-N(1))-methyltransferase
VRVVNGKHICQMDRAEVLAWTGKHRETTVDLGAGDGRFVGDLAKQDPELGAIGVDLVAANLRQASRTAADNALYVVADALALPEELRDVASRVTINFPWGSLLRGLLNGHPDLMAGLAMIGSNGVALEIVVNAGALTEEGWDLEDGGTRIAASLRDAGVNIQNAAPLGPADLRRWPTTWAKRLAFGRDPRAVQITGIRHPSPVTRHPLCYTPRLAGVEPAY